MQQLKSRTGYFQRPISLRAVHHSRQEFADIIEIKKEYQQQIKHQLKQLSRTGVQAGIGRGSYHPEESESSKMDSKTHIEQRQDYMESFARLRKVRLQIIFRNLMTALELNQTASKKQKVASQIYSNKAIANCFGIWKEETSNSELKQHTMSINKIKISSAVKQFQEQHEILHKTERCILLLKEQGFGRLVMGLRMEMRRSKNKESNMNKQEEVIRALTSRVVQLGINRRAKLKQIERKSLVVENIILHRRFLRLRHSTKKAIAISALPAASTHILSVIEELGDTDSQASIRQGLENYFANQQVELTEDHVAFMTRIIKLHKLQKQMGTARKKQFMKLFCLKQKQMAILTLLRRKVIAILIERKEDTRRVGRLMELVERVRSKVLNSYVLLLISTYQHKTSPQEINVSQINAAMEVPQSFQLQAQLPEPAIQQFNCRGMKTTQETNESKQCIQRSQIRSSLGMKETSKPSLLVAQPTLDIDWEGGHSSLLEEQLENQNIQYQMHSSSNSSYRSPSRSSGRSPSKSRLNSPLKSQVLSEKSQSTPKPIFLQDSSKLYENYDEEEEITPEQSEIASEDSDDLDDRRTSRLNALRALKNFQIFRQGWREDLTKKSTKLKVYRKQTSMRLLLKKMQSGGKVNYASLKELVNKQHNNIMKERLKCLKRGTAAAINIRKKRHTLESKLKSAGMKMFQKEGRLELDFSCKMHTLNEFQFMRKINELRDTFNVWRTHYERIISKSDRDNLCNKSQQVQQQRPSFENYVSKTHILEASFEGSEDSEDIIARHSQQCKAMEEAKVSMIFEIKRAKRIGSMQRKIEEAKLVQDHIKENQDPPCQMDKSNCSSQNSVDQTKMELRRMVLMKVFLIIKTNAEEAKLQEKEISGYLGNINTKKIKQKCFKQWKKAREQKGVEGNSKERLNSLGRCFGGLLLYSRQKILLRKVLNQEDIAQQNYHLYALSLSEQLEFNRLKCS